jgi:hypothetical protein
MTHKSRLSVDGSRENQSCLNPLSKDVPKEFTIRIATMDEERSKNPLYYCYHIKDLWKAIESNHVEPTTGGIFDKDEYLKILHRYIDYLEKMQEIDEDDFTILRFDTLGPGFSHPADASERRNYFDFIKSPFTQQEKRFANGDRITRKGQNEDVLLYQRKNSIQEELIKAFPDIYIFIANKWLPARFYQHDAFIDFITSGKQSKNYTPLRGVSFDIERDNSGKILLVRENGESSEMKFMFK